MGGGGREVQVEVVDAGDLHGVRQFHGDEDRPAAAAAHLPNQWLFPSTRAGKHTTPGALATRLRRIGVTGRAMRHAALIQLAAEIPPGALAGILGIHPTTAVKWTKLAGGDWTHYAATRGTST